MPGLIFRASPKTVQGKLVLAAAAGPNCYGRQKEASNLGVRLASPCAPRPAARKEPRAVPRASPHHGTLAGPGNRGDLSRAPWRHHDRLEGMRRQDPAQLWPLLPLEPRPPAQSPAAPRLPGAGPSSTTAASARSRSRIFPPLGAVIPESAAAARRAGPPLGLLPQLWPAQRSPWI